MKDATERAIIIISLIKRKGNIILVNPPNVRNTKALISRKRTNEDNIATMIGIVLVLLRVIVNTPTVVYKAALIIATKNIAIININPAKRPPIIPTITSPIFSTLISNEKLKRTAKDSGSINIRAKIVTVLISNNTPITILNVLIIFIINFHLHFGFQGNNFDIRNYL